MNENRNTLPARADLEKLLPYDADPSPGMIKMDANECPFEFPPRVKEQIFQVLSPAEFCRYPDPMAESLREALAEYIGFPPDYILTGNGSDEVILNLIQTFAPGGDVILTPPTFSMYNVHSMVAGVNTVSIPRLPDFSVDVDRIIKEQMTSDSRIIFICSPNNPTANEISREDLCRLLENSRALVAVDEAYVEFGGKTCLPLMKKYSNLAVMRSFSKAFGLAGMRVGYLIARPDVINRVKRVKQPFNLNTFSQRAALAVLENLPVFHKIIAEVTRLREQMLDRMRQIRDVETLPTVTNFITFKTSWPAELVHRNLAEGGVLIRNVSSPGLENFLRVSVGTGKENETFINLLQDILR